MSALPRTFSYFEINFSENSIYFIFTSLLSATSVTGLCWCSVYRFPSSSFKLHNLSTGTGILVNIFKLFGIQVNVTCVCLIQFPAFRGELGLALWGKKRYFPAFLPQDGVCFHKKKGGVIAKVSHHCTVPYCRLKAYWQCTCFSLMFKLSCQQVKSGKVPVQLLCCDATIPECRLVSHYWREILSQIPREFLFSIHR